MENMPQLISKNKRPVGSLMNRTLAAYDTVALDCFVAHVEFSSLYEFKRGFST